LTEPEKDKIMDLPEKDKIMDLDLKVEHRSKGRT
jgi:hypothetical protein